MWRIASGLIATGACLIFVLALQAQNYVCTPYQSPSGGNDRYLATPTDQLMTGTVAVFEDESCLTQTDSVEADSQGWAYAGTLEAAEALCRAGAQSLIDHPDANRASFNQFLWRCIARVRGRLSSNLLRPPRPTGETLMEGSLLRLYALDGMDSGIHYQRVREAGIGLPAIVGLGWLDAVDVWGDVGAGYKVCFPQTGRAIFLDAAYSPRQARDVPYELDDGYTCVALDAAGTTVLLTDPAANIDDSAPIALAGCSVTTLHNLHLRDAPEGTVQTQQVPGQISLPSWSRTERWFAIQYDGYYGWVAERFVNAEGECDYSAPAQA